MRRSWLLFLTLVVVLGFSGVANATPILVGHWAFDEGIGVNAIDSSVNSLNGIISNASYIPGRIGAYALDFNGSNSYVEVADNPLLENASMGISLWFKNNSGDYLTDLLDKGHGSTPYYGGYVLQQSGDPNTAAFSISPMYGNGSGFPGVTVSGSIDDQWHHLVANLGEAGLAVYLDGVLIQGASGQGPIVPNDSPLYFGRHRLLGRYFDGFLDDIRIYDGSLSQNDVNELYGAPVPEPATMLLLGTGLAGLAAFRKRFRKS